RSKRDWSSDVCSSDLGNVLQVHETQLHVAWVLGNEKLRFVDLEDIPGVFREPLPRVSLDNLPDEGAWLQPFRPLTALAERRDNKDRKSVVQGKRGGRE